MTSCGIVEYWTSWGYSCVVFCFQLEQMDLEIHDMPANVRPTLTGRLRNYRAELQRLKKELVRIIKSYSLRLLLLSVTVILT